MQMGEEAIAVSAAQARPQTQTPSGGPPKASIAGAINAGKPPPWVRQIKDMHQGGLFTAFAREAVVHRDLIVSRAPVPSTWRSFRQFMLDIGPAPEGDGWVLSLKDESAHAYEPGNTRWAQAADPLAFFWRKEPGGVQGEWNRAPRLEAPASASGSTGPPVSAAAANEAEEAAFYAGSAVQGWLPADAERQAAFKRAFRMWRSQVKPSHRASAKPAFLFLYSTALLLKDLRGELMAAGLWDAHTARQKERDKHPAWGRYCEHLMRAEAALSSLPELNGYSLYSDLDKLIERLVRTEQKYRS